MSEAELDRLLDAISEAVAPGAPGTPWPERSPQYEPPKAANDNGLAWPLIPFPDGWNAAC